jgi:hypothetical protein
VFNRLRDAGALEDVDGRWRIEGSRVRPALERLLIELDALEDEGAADAFVQQSGRTTDALVRALDDLDAAGVPADVVFEAETPVAEPR